MKQEIIKVPLKDINSPVVVGQIITLESENFSQFMVKTINSKSAHLRRLVDIRDIAECSSLEQKFVDLWLKLHPDISLINQFPVLDYGQSPVKTYKADFYHIPSSTVIEIHGGIWMPASGHNTGSGITKNCEKLCLCTSLGMKYFALTSKMINEYYLNLIANTISLRGDNAEK
ncbi:MAG TPA: hypothetical protein V6C58_03360 [Allocoleopsis sp.]